MSGGIAWKKYNKARSIMFGGYTVYVASVSKNPYYWGEATTAIYPSSSGKVNNYFSSEVTEVILSVPSTGDPNVLVDIKQSAMKGVAYIPFLHKRMSDTNSPYLFTGHISQASYANGHPHPRNYHGVLYQGTIYQYDYILDARVKNGYMVAVSGWTGGSADIDIVIAPISSSGGFVNLLPIYNVRTTTNYNSSQYFSLDGITTNFPMPVGAASHSTTVKCARVHPDCTEVSILIDHAIVYADIPTSDNTWHTVHNLYDVKILIVDDANSPLTFNKVAQYDSTTLYPDEQLVLKTTHTKTAAKSNEYSQHISDLWWGYIPEYHPAGSILDKYTSNEIDSDDDLSQIVGIVTTIGSLTYGGPDEYLEIAPGPIPTTWYVTKVGFTPPYFTRVVSLKDAAPTNWNDYAGVQATGDIYQVTENGGIPTPQIPYTASKGVCEVWAYEATAHVEVVLMGSGYKVGFLYDDDPNSLTYGSRFWITCKPRGTIPAGGKYLDYTETTKSAFVAPKKLHSLGGNLWADVQPPSTHKAYPKYLAWIQSLIDAYAPGGNKTSGTVNVAVDFESALYLEKPTGDHLLNVAGKAYYYSGLLGATVSVKAEGATVNPAGTVSVSYRQTEGYLDIQNTEVTVKPEQTGVDISYYKNSDYNTTVDECGTFEDAGYGINGYITTGYKATPLATVDGSGLPITKFTKETKHTIVRKLYENEQERILTVNVNTKVDSEVQVLPTSSGTHPYIRGNFGFRFNGLQAMTDISSVGNAVSNAYDDIKFASYNDGVCFKEEVYPGITLISVHFRRDGWTVDSGAGAYPTWRNSFMWLQDSSHNILADIATLKTPTGTAPVNITQSPATFGGDITWAGVVTGYTMAKM